MEHLQLFKIEMESVLTCLHTKHSSFWCRPTYTRANPRDFCSVDVQIEKQQKRHLKTTPIDNDQVILTKIKRVTTGTIRRNSLTKNAYEGSFFAFGWS